MGKKGAPGLASQFEPLYLKIPPSIIQEENDTQESQQGQKTPPLVLSDYLGMPNRGHGVPRENTQVDLPGSPQKIDPDT